MIEVSGTPIVIMGDWDTSPEPEGKLIIRMPKLPPRTRGAGWNVDTQNCIRELTARLKPGMTVLDLGCGSGIIGIAARMLGADVVYATEYNPVLCEFAKKVAALNGIDMPVVPSHEELPHVDICVANIGAKYVQDMRPTIDADVVITALDDDGSVVVYA